MDFEGSTKVTMTVYDAATDNVSNIDATDTVSRTRFRITKLGSADS